MNANQTGPLTVALLFPGQGSQQVGMGRALADRFPAAREVFEEADEVLGFSLSRICFEGPEDVLAETSNTQPAILTTSIAALRAFQSVAGGQNAPQFMAGHSLGEYSALVAAGVLSFADALTLVRLRGQLMSEAGRVSPGGMAAILGLDVAVLDDICTRASEQGGVVQIANDNAPGQVVISGDIQALERAMALAHESGARRIVRLAVSIAAHSRLMAAAAEKLSDAIRRARLHAPRAVVIGNAEAQPLRDLDVIRNELVMQLTTVVRWTETVRYLMREGINEFVEVGPGSALSGLVKRIAPDAAASSVGDPDSLEAFHRSYLASAI